VVEESEGGISWLREEKIGKRLEKKNKLGGLERLVPGESRRRREK